MRSEKGQAIVFLALGFVTFLGFVALALDGGFVFADRRHAQNSSDASSLSGSSAAALSLANDAYDHPEVTYPDWDCSSYWVQVAEWLGQNSAIARAASNGFTIDPLSLDTDNTYVTTDCRNWWNGSYYDRWLDVTVNISDSTETSFAHLLFPEPLGNVVSATARVMPRSPFGLGNAIIALNYECQGNDGGVTFSGNNNVHINGGGIFSNDCFIGNGTSTSVEVEPEGTLNVCTDTGCWDPNGKPAINPTPIEGENPYGIPPESVYIPAPTCIGGNLGHIRLNNGQSATINPGTYEYITVNNGGTLYLNPGLYCITDPGGVSISGSAKVWGPADYDLNAGQPFLTGVAFYMVTGGFGVSGGSGGTPSVRLTAAMQGSCEPTDDDSDPCPGIEHPGMTAVLIFLAHDNDSSVTLIGDSFSDFTGLIYAPDGRIKVGGTANGLSNYNLQMIADTIEVEGSPEMTITYDNQFQRWTSAMIELAK